MTKICIKCKETKEVKLFVKTKNSCKECEKEYKKNHREKNKEILKEKAAIYYKENKESILQRVAENYSQNKDKKLSYQKKYAYLNKDKISAYKMAYQKNRRKNDPIFKLKFVVSRMIRNSLRRRELLKSKKTVEILGCDIAFFKTNLQQKFINDMSWDNYGTHWDIDHIVPLSTAKTEDDVLRLNHFSNLQPLDSHINRNIKRDKIDFYENPVE